MLLVTLFPTGIPGYLVAVKQLKSTEASALEELTREAVFMAQLNHNNIIRLHGVVTVSPYRTDPDPSMLTILTATTGWPTSNDGDRVLRAR